MIFFVKNTKYKFVERRLEVCHLISQTTKTNKVEMANTKKVFHSLHWIFYGKTASFQMDLQKAPYIPSEHIFLEMNSLESICLGT